MEKMPKREKQDAERDFYVSLNKWVNERLLQVDSDLSARIVSVIKEPGMQDITNQDSQNNVILISSMSDSSMEWAVPISIDFAIQEKNLDLFEKDYREYKNEGTDIKPLH